MLNYLLVLVDDVDGLGHLDDLFDGVLYGLLHRDVVGGHFVNGLHDCVGHLLLFATLPYCRCNLLWNLSGDRHLLRNDLRDRTCWQS